MKKLWHKILNVRQKVYDFYSTKSTKEIIVLTALFLFGFWWPLGSCIVYVFLAFYSEGKYKVYGLFSIIGGGLNMFYYILVVLLRLISIA